MRGRLRQVTFVLKLVEAQGSRRGYALPLDVPRVFLGVSPLGAYSWSQVQTKQRTLRASVVDFAH
jgi:hypothetical protein